MPLVSDVSKAPTLIATTLPFHDPVYVLPPIFIGTAQVAHQVNAARVPAARDLYSGCITGLTFSAMLSCWRGILRALPMMPSESTAKGVWNWGGGTSCYQTHHDERMSHRHSLRDTQLHRVKEVSRTFNARGESGREPLDHDGECG